MSRILLIEDEPATQLLYRNRLADLGYEVVVASTGARGLMEARADVFDLFLVDIHLGSGINGYEVCRRLKAVPELHGIPVVLISGQVKGQEELHRGYEAGCEAFLLKGEMTLLEDVVRAMLRIKSLQDDLGLQNRLLEEHNRRLQEERKRGADLETALRESGKRAIVFQDLAAGRPEGVLIVDSTGIVRMADRGARGVFGREVEGKQLARLTPAAGLEAFVRNARTDPHEAFRFDLGTRSCSASVLPLLPGKDGEERGLRVVLIHDASRRRMAAEVLRLEEKGVPRRELGPLLEAARRVFHPAALIGESREARELRARVARAAASDNPVLIRGETGSGKTLAARIIHFSGPRSGAFVPVNCAALSSEHLEAEILGHTKDAFPQAVADRPGLIHQAQQGTLFLDEIHELPLHLQARLLEALETGRVHRVGATVAEQVEVRLLAASGVNLEARMANEQFRPDLFYRLSGMEVRLPSLRERPGDIPMLVNSFLERHGAARGGMTLSGEAHWLLTEHDWPGNVRELANLIETACAMSPDLEIQVSDLSPSLGELHQRFLREGAIPAALPSPPLPPSTPLTEPLEEGPLLEVFEKKALLYALEQTDGDKLAAARLVGVGKSTFYRKLKAHHLT